MGFTPIKMGHEWCMASPGVTGVVQLVPGPLGSPSMCWGRAVCSGVAGVAQHVPVSLGFRSMCQGRRGRTACAGVAVVMKCVAGSLGSCSVCLREVSVKLSKTGTEKFQTQRKTWK